VVVALYHDQGLIAFKLEAFATGSTRRSGCRSPGRRQTTGRPSTSPAAASPIPAAWGKPSAWRRPSARPALERGPDLPVRVPFLDRLALLVFALAAGEGDLQLDLAPVADEHARRDDGQPALLGLAGQALDLAAVEEELAVPEGSWLKMLAAS